MNPRFRDRLSFCSAIGIGLGISTGHPMGIIAAVGMPLACLTAGTRKAAFKSTLGYYVAGIWPMVPAWRATSGSPRFLLSLLRCGSSPQSYSRFPGPLPGHLIASIASGEYRSRSWSQSSLRSGLSALLLRSRRRAIFFPERLGLVSQRSRFCQGLFSRRTLWPRADVALFCVSLARLP